uniref:DNA repair protein RAD51 homolog 4 n=1 Tax=Cacopsylla melanoneura TaxID=428564 RepID=A0A8D9DU38_9HEMI
MTLLDSSMHSLLTSDILKLLSLGKVYTIQNFLSEPVEKLISITKLNFKKILQIKTSLLNKYSPVLMSGTALAQSSSQSTKSVSSGIGKLDNLLLGGLCPGSVYEVCSPAGDGKTQMCHTIAAFIKHPVYWFDSKGDFSAKRICQISNKDIEGTLSRIQVCRVESLLHLIEALYDLVSRFDSSSCQEIRIVVVDSVPTHFYALLDTSVNCQGYLSQIGNLLKYLAHRHSCIVLTTNLLSLASEPHEEDRPGMGKYWNHVPHVRLKMVSVGDGYRLSIMQSNSRRLSHEQVELVKISLKGVH